MTTAIEAALAALDGEPDYHYSGMGCGLEDRGITDRYEAMKYGWECAMERVYAEHINPAKEALSAGWRPIDTVPDGDELIIVGGYNFRKQWCSEVWHTSYLREQRAKIAAGFFKDSPHLEWRPTHWIPLPASPEHVDTDVMIHQRSERIAKPEAEKGEWGYETTHGVGAKHGEAFLTKNGKLVATVPIEVAEIVFNATKPEATEGGAHEKGWKYEQIDWKFVKALCQAFSTRVGEGSYDQFMIPVQQRWLTGMKAALMDATAEFNPLVARAALNAKPEQTEHVDTDVLENSASLNTSDQEGMAND